MKKIFLLSLPIVFLCLISSFSWSKDLTDLSIKELMGIEVTSASKKNEKLSDTPAAIFVLTEEDIARSGVTNVPDLLRLVPGVQVGRIDANKWAISIRGNQSRFADRLLVLVDGMTIYSSLFGGVIWEAEDIMLEDIQRIEVIRGPGGTIWGANAVNGVINIITKSAKTTQGALFTLGGGTEDLGFMSARYGGQIKDSFFRIYAKGQMFDDGYNSSTAPDDDLKRGTVGFRTDTLFNQADQLTIIGNYAQSQSHHIVTVPVLTSPYTSTFSESYKNQTAHFFAKFNHEFHENNNMSFQFFYNLLDINSTTYVGNHHTIDFEWQHRFQIWNHHDVVWGAGYRTYLNESSATVLFNQGIDDQQHIANAFVQDEISLTEDFKFILGSKVSFNDYTGFEYQPSLKMSWRVHNDHFLWASASISIRTPSVAQDKIQFNANSVAPNVTSGTPAGYVRFTGNPNLKSEKSYVFETGIKSKITENLGLDIATFLVLERDVVQFSTGTAFLETNPNVALIVPYSPSNSGSSTNLGFEIVPHFEVTDWWHLKGHYSFVRVDESSKQVYNFQFATLDSQMDLPHNLYLDVVIRFVDDLDDVSIGRYVVGDVRIAWKPSDKVELSIMGRNLFDKHHYEYVSTFINTVSTEVEQSVHGKLLIKF